MSLTAYDHDPACKPLEDAGFTDAQIAALSEFTRQKIAFGGKTAQLGEAGGRAARPAVPAREGSIGHALAMLVLAVTGLGALLAILVRVA